MKSSLLKTLLCASVLVFAVGCGKENKSGSKSSSASANPYNSANPFYTNPTVQTQQAMANATAWFQSNAEIPSTIGQRTEKRDKLIFSSHSCNTKTLLGFIDINICKSGEISNTDLPDRVVNVLQSNNKALNLKLAPVFSPASGATLSSATEAASPMGNSGRLFKLTYVKTNGHILQYIIDSGLNSAFNPVEIYDSELSEGEVVTNPYQLL